MNKKCTAMLPHAILKLLFLVAVFTGFHAQAATPMVSAGDSHTCAVLSSGAVQCWGSNAYGQLGTGSSSSSVPVAVSGISNAISISASVYNTCALLGNGTVQCWGSNYHGQLGTGNTTSSFNPVSVSGIATAKSVASGSAHACAVLTDGKVKCWGNNDNGQLGNGNVANSSSAVSVAGITTAATVSAGLWHTCASLQNGSVQCWGYNANGQLGNGNLTNSPTPVNVVGINSATAVSIGHSHSCALLTTGSVQCWGKNQSGQLGNGNTTDSNTPVTVSGIGTATTLSGSDSSVCATLRDGTVQCWGNNDYGQLGNGNKARSSLPLSKTGISSATGVTSSVYNTCVTQSDGSVKCWGTNFSGQMGDGTTTGSTTGGITSVTVADLNLGTTTTPSSGVCGSANGTSAPSAPTSGLCSIGTPGSMSISPAGGGITYLWQCLGSNAETLASCSATQSSSVITPVTGTCGTTNGTSVVSIPTSGLCNSGNATEPYQNGSTYLWSCAGLNGGNTTSCQANLSTQPTPTTTGICGATQTDVANTHTPVYCQLSLTPQTLTFPEQTVGTRSGTSNITLNAYGTWPSTIAGFDVTGDFEQTNNCSPRLYDTNSCTLFVTFKPTAAGVRSGTVTIRSNSSSGNVVANLSGNGKTSNTPTEIPITGSRLFTYAENNYSTIFSGSPVSGQILNYIYRYYPSTGNYLATDSTGFVYVFGPVSANTFKNLGSIQTFQAAITDWERNTSGTTGLLTVEPQALTFQTQTPGTSSYSQTVYLQNTGSDVPNLEIWYLTPSDFTYTSTCGPAIASGGTCSIDVTFKPSVYGDYIRHGYFTVKANNITQKITQRGTVPALPLPSISVTPSSLTFGAISIGSSSSPNSVTITNTGSAPLNITCIELMATGASSNCVQMHMEYIPFNYSETHTCRFSTTIPYPPTIEPPYIIEPKGNLAPGESCTVSVTFKPIEGGVSTGFLNIMSNDKNTPLISIPINGTVAPKTCVPPQVLVGNICENPVTNTCNPPSERFNGMGCFDPRTMPCPNVVTQCTNFYNPTTGERINSCTTLDRPMSCQGVAGGVIPGTGTTNGGFSGGTGLDAKSCLQFTNLTAEQNTDWGGFAGAQQMKNICNVPISVYYCHTPSSIRGTSGGNCGAGINPDVFYQLSTTMQPGEKGSNPYSLPLGTTVYYGACRGGRNPDRPLISQDGMTGNYSCK